MCVGVVVRQKYTVEARSYVPCCDRICLAKTDGWIDEVPYTPTF